MNERDWYNHFRNDPKNAYENAKMCNTWQLMHRLHLRNLLQQFPKFIEFYKDKPFPTKTWICILQGNINNEELIKIIPWEKITSSEWTTLLVRHPQFRFKCDWSQFSSFQLNFITSYRPSLRINVVATMPIKLRIRKLNECSDSNTIRQFFDVNQYRI